MLLRYETTIGSVSGADLKTIWNRWGRNQELQSVPDVKLDAIEDKKTYRVHIPMDLYIKLGQRRKNLGKPQAGPRISPEGVMAKVFE